MTDDEGLVPLEQQIQQAEQELQSGGRNKRKRNDEKLYGADGCSALRIIERIFLNTSFLRELGSPRILRNPAKRFNAKAGEGAYASLSDAEYNRKLEAVNALASLWGNKLSCETRELAVNALLHVVLTDPELRRQARRKCSQWLRENLEEIED